MKKVAKLAKKAELQAEQDKITIFQAFDSRYFRGKRYFEDYNTQNYFSQYIVILKILVVLSYFIMDV